MTTLHDIELAEDARGMSLLALIGLCAIGAVILTLVAAGIVLLCEMPPVEALR